MIKMIANGSLVRCKDTGRLGLGMSNPKEKPMKNKEPRRACFFVFGFFVTTGRPWVGLQAFDEFLIGKCRSIRTRPENAIYRSKEEIRITVYIVLKNSIHL